MFCILLGLIISFDSQSWAIFLICRYISISTDWINKFFFFVSFVFCCQMENFYASIRPIIKRNKYCKMSECECRWSQWHVTTINKINLIIRVEFLRIPNCKKKMFLYVYVFGAFLNDIFLFETRERPWQNIGTLINAIACFKSLNEMNWDGDENNLFMLLVSSLYFFQLHSQLKKNTWIATVLKKINAAMNNKNNQIKLNWIIVSALQSFLLTFSHSYCSCAAQNQHNFWNRFKFRQFYAFVCIFR